MKGSKYGTMPDGTQVDEYTLTNANGVELKVITYGCTITSLKVPDRDDVFENIVLGFDSLEGYLHSKHYMGCVIGRYANRIALGKFQIDDHKYSLPVNMQPHHLHGGSNGFNQKIWSAKTFKNKDGEGIDFHYTSLDGEENYPGTVDVSVRYFLNDDNVFAIHYLAKTDRKTIINLTQHSYFNLNIQAENILQHGLVIHADHYLPVDKTMIPTGEVKPVDGTPFDFRELKLVGKDLVPDDAQIRIANGYDHNFVLRKDEEGMLRAATLFDFVSGRTMEVYTTEPGLQLYTANFLDEREGRGQKIYGAHAGLCLETQHYPDSPNHPAFPSVHLKPGNEYRSTTVYQFSTV